MGLREADRSLDEEGRPGPRRSVIGPASVPGRASSPPLASPSRNQVSGVDAEGAGRRPAAGAYLAISTFLVVLAGLLWIGRQSSQGNRDVTPRHPIAAERPSIPRAPERAPLVANGPDRTALLQPVGTVGAGGGNQASGNLLASGRVLDPSGWPIAGAVVGVEVPEKAGSGDWIRWRELEELRCETQAEGAFQISCPLVFERIALTARHPDYAPGQRVESPSRVEGVLLELRPAGTLEGLLLLDPWIPASSFAVHARSTEEGGSAYQGQMTADGHFTIPGLEPGLYAVLVSLRHEPETAWTLEIASVLAHRSTRLLPTDLRGRVHSFTLRARRPDGSFTGSFRLRRRIPGAREFGATSQNAADGEATVVTMMPSVDLLIESQVHRPEIIERVDGDRWIQLYDAPKIQLVLENGLSLAAQGLWLGAYAEPRAPGLRGPGRLVAFDERGVAELTVRGPGLHDIVVQVWKRGAVGVSALLSKRVEASVDLPASSYGITFPLRLSEQTLSRIEAEWSAGSDQPPEPASGSM